MIQLPDITESGHIKSEIFYTLSKYFAKTTQFFTWPFAFIFFNTFFKLEINGRENLTKTASPSLIISNHISEYDSFLFRLVVGMTGKKLPLRFMAVNRFNIWYLNVLSKLFITNVIYFIFGVFVIEEGAGLEKNLREPLRIIRHGGNVVIYPEGSIIESGKIERFKLGASVLLKMTSIPVIPVSLRIVRGKMSRNHFIVNVGKSMTVDPSLSPEEITDKLHSEISFLHFRSEGDLNSPA